MNDVPTVVGLVSVPTVIVSGPGAGEAEAVLLLYTIVPPAAPVESFDHFHRFR
jgi:hypothetical protein